MNILFNKKSSPRSHARRIPPAAPLLSNHESKKRGRRARQTVRNIMEKNAAASRRLVNHHCRAGSSSNVSISPSSHISFFTTVFLLLMYIFHFFAVTFPSPVHSPEAPEPEAPPPSMCTMACFPCARYCLCCAAVTMACSAAVAATLLAAFLLRMFLFSR